MLKLALRAAPWLSLLLAPAVAMELLNLWGWDFTIPLAYGAPGADEVWQLVATKTLLDTGWVLTNPFLGAPGISTWYANSGSQTSALHSVLLLCVSVFVKDPVAVQQVYYLLNFALIGFATYWVCRSLHISSWPAAAVGWAFAFTSFRLHALFFAYLSNYFTVPFAVLLAIWILRGDWTAPDGLHAGQSRRVRGPLGLLATRRFAIGAVLAALIATSDGYYAFFCLLTLGFATGVRLVAGDWRKPGNLAPGVGLIVIVMASALALASPLSAWRKSHPDEANQDLMKQSSDAEVYSPTLKLLIAPPLDHRIDLLGSIGEKMVATANFNRRFPFTHGAPATLGLLGTLFLIVALARLSVLIFDRRANVSPVSAVGSSPSVLACTSLLSAFVLLCSVTGGIGSLVAFLYPSIRAYERFPIFLILLLFIGAAAWWSDVTTRWRMPVVGALVAVFIAAFAIFDQSPEDLLGLSKQEGRADRSTRYLAERRFIQHLENTLPPDSMVYQLPWSQYLSDNPYYGWGAFGQERLYLHSKTLRWSNGGAKGSSVDDWHERMSFLPIDRLVVEMRAVGFRAIVVDRLVVKAPEYAQLKADLNRLLGSQPVEDDNAQLASWLMPRSHVSLGYAADFHDVETLTIDVPLASEERLPAAIDAHALRARLATVTAYPITLAAKDAPDLFIAEGVRSQALGQEKVADVATIRGDLNCGAQTLMHSQDEIRVATSNLSSIDWKLGAGKYPLRVGAQLYRADGAHVRDAIVPSTAYLPAGDTIAIPFPLIALFKPTDAAGARYRVRIALLQDANAWFVQAPNRSCDFEVVH